VSDAPARAAAQVLALLDDAACGAALLELASPLARVLQRELSVVYVESARSLVAAALPCTQVLAHSGLQWMPLQPGDVEQGFRAHEARLRELTARIALRDALHWSLRVVRGNLGEAAARLQSESDLLLLAHAPPLQPRSSRTAPQPRRPPVVATLGDGDDASRRALQVATQLARALQGVVQVAHIDTVARLPEQPDRLRALAHCDVLVLPRATLDAVTLALLRCPVLLVG
jgi:hypothetical protein